MQDVKVSGPAAAAPPRPTSRVPGPDSLFWLVLVSVLFLAAQLGSGLLHMLLGADEITYIAPTSIHQSLIELPPVHGQGAGLLAAPVTLFTTSLVTLRVWMACLSTIGLFLSLLCWRGLRSARLLALAGLIFGSLAISQNSAVQVYPDWWSALGLLALTGLFLQVVKGTTRPRLVLSMIGFTCFVVVLMRPQNIAFILGPVIVAALVVRAWRKFSVLAAMAAGIVLGLAQWVLDAFLWYGGLASRIQQASHEPPSFRLYFSFLFQAKVLSGPWYCPTHSGCPGWAMPGETAWFVALLGLGILGLWASWRTSAKASSVLAGLAGLWVLVFYSFLVPFGAPRYILPTLALLSILAADGIVWLATESRWRTAGIVVGCLFVLSGIVSQRVVLNREIKTQNDSRQFQAHAQQLAKLGIHAPCVTVSTSISYYAGCYGPWTGQTIPELLAGTPQGVNGWQLVPAPGVPVQVFVPK